MHPEPLNSQPSTFREREFYIDDLLVRIHLIIEMILVDGPCGKLFLVGGMGNPEPSNKLRTGDVPLGLGLALDRGGTPQPP